MERRQRTLVSFHHPWRLLIVLQLKQQLRGRTTDAHMVSEKFNASHIFSLFVCRIWVKRQQLQTHENLEEVEKRLGWWNGVKWNFLGVGFWGRGCVREWSELRVCSEFWSFEDLVCWSSSNGRRSWRPPGRRCASKTSSGPGKSLSVCWAPFEE